MLNKICYLLIAIIFFYINPVTAEDSQLQERLVLIQASQNLAVQEEVILENRVGIFVTDFGAYDGEVSLGGNLELPLFNQEVLRILSEVIYLREEESLAGFISLKFVYPVKSNFAFYLGGGDELTGEAERQFFVGINILEDFFIEGKYIKQDESVSASDSEIYFAVGLQLGF